MKIKNLVRTFITSALLVAVVAFSTQAFAETYEVSGNGTGSNNSIQINQNNGTNVNQSNSADVNNSVNINSNTGGNSLNGNVGDGSITTGNVTNNVNINNNLNNNVANVNNCCVSPTPKNPTPTKKPGQPSVTPTPQGGNGGRGGNGGGGNGDGGAGGAGGSSPAVLGLAQTSGENDILALLKLLPAFGSVAFGYALLKKNA